MNKVVKNVLGVVSIIYGALCITAGIYSVYWMRKFSKENKKTELEGFETSEIREEVKKQNGDYIETKMGFRI